MSIRRTTSIPRLRLTGSLALACAIGFVAGCQTTPAPTPVAPAPATRLLDAARFSLPTDCTVTGGRSYRISYTVGIDGRTGSLGAITPPDAPVCLQAALASWVATFRYAPPAHPEAVTHDWMLVTARRGS